MRYIIICNVDDIESQIIFMLVIYINIDISTIQNSPKFMAPKNICTTELLK